MSLGAFRPFMDFMMNVYRNTDMLWFGVVVVRLVLLEIEI